MGKATRWLRGLLGGKKDSGVDILKEKKRLEKRNNGVEEQRRKTLDIVVVRNNLSIGKRSSYVCREDVEFAAALSIQSVFRGFLARKAIRALRALVKIQALVRGFLVRKQVAIALRHMHALIRAQSIVLDRRSRVLPPRRSLLQERSGGLCASSKIVEMDTSANTNIPRWTNHRGTSPSCGSNLGDDSLPSPRISNCNIPLRLSIPKSTNQRDEERCPIYKYGCYLSSANNTPRFQELNFPISPRQMTSSRSVRRGLGYMANTRSFTAKVRSHSAPRQRLGSPGSPRIDESSGEATSHGGAEEAIMLSSV